MTTDPAIPDDGQERAAKSRLVRYDALKELVYSIAVSIQNEVTAQANRRLADGGAMRSVPLDDEGIFPAGGTARDAFDAMTAGMAAAANRLEDVVIDWSETDAFKNFE